jgi:cytochrome c553
MQLSVLERILRNFTIVLCFLVIAPMTAVGQDLASGPGADTLTTACQKCHGLGPIISQHHDLDGWRTIIAQMISNGAILSDQDADKIASYLATNYGVGQPSGVAPTTSVAPGSNPSVSR